MSKSTPRSSSRSRFILLISASFLAIFALVLAIHPGRSVQAVGSSTIVISEFRTRGPNGAADEFVELYNVSNSAVDISGWKINGSNNAAGISTRVTIAASTTIPAHGHFLATNSSASGGPYSGSVPGNQTFATGITDDGGIALLTSANVVIDQVGMSTGSAYKEGTILAPMTTTLVNRGYERRPGGSSGSTQDTDNNGNDFIVTSPSDPQNLSSPPTPSGNQAIAPNCPASLNTTQGTATSGSVSATDPDGRVTSASITVTPAESGITLQNFVAAVSNNTAATANLNVAATTAAGTYNVTIQYSNNDPTPQTASCSVLVTVASPNQQISPNCPTPLSTTLGTATSEGVSATDPDGIVTSATITSTAVAGITLDSFVAAPSNNTAATATLNVAATTAAGSYSVIIQYTNNDSPTPQTASCTIAVTVNAPAGPASVVISEFRTTGPGGGNDEFVELYNVTNAPIAIGGWKINGSNSSGTASTRVTINAGTTIPAHGHFLATNSGAYSGAVSGDQTYATGITDTGGIALLNASGTTIDQVGLNVGSAYKEGTVLSPLTASTNQGYERKPGGASGSTQDTDNNANDFIVTAPSAPQNLASAPTPGGPVNQPINPSCPSSLNTPIGTPASASVSATDTDGMVTGASITTSPATSGITLDSFVPAGSVGGTATATLNVANTTAGGTYNVTIQYSNNDSPTPQTASCTVVITVTAPPAPFNAAIKISQVYGGGGNSGSTYTRDFIELYNTGSTPVDINGWSVQYTGATTAFAPLSSPTPPGVPTTLTTTLSGTIQPGHYYLIQESQGATGTTSLPTADLTGGILVGSTAGKIALVANSNVLVGGTTGNCPTDPLIVDFIGYGISPTTASCSETSPTVTLTNTTAAIRKNNGCTDTDNNSNDFLIDGPIPRNSASPVHRCGGDSTQLSGSGLATSDSIQPSGNTLLTVTVFPASIPPSSGIGVSADLTSIGGSASQVFYDDGTHGDQFAGDNIFSFRAIVGAFIPTGVKNVVATITDAQTRSASEAITITVESPTCGVERWSVKTGTDTDASQVDLINPVPTTIAALGLLTPPTVFPPNSRFGTAERTVYVVTATMTLYKLEDDVDYHIVLQDATGHTMVTEIPCACCVGLSSPFAAAIANARARFDSRLTANTFFQPANFQVRVTGVGFFDPIHGQTGVAPNGIELHPILDIVFLDQTTTNLASSANPSQYGQSVQITATVASAGPNTPSGNVTFSDGVNVVANSLLDGSGHASFTSSSLSVGSHSITASYPGDSDTLASTSTVFTQVVNKADQSINFGALAGKTYGDAPFMVSATASSGLPVSFQILSGPATISGNTVTITGAGAVTVRASQAGDGNYNAAPDFDQSFTVAQATATINVTGFSGAYDGNAHGASGSATGINGEDLSSLLNLGGSFTNVPGGTAHWTFAGNTNYAPSSGDVAISISKASSSTTVTCPGSEIYTGSAIEPCTASYSGAGGLSGSLTPTYSNNTEVGTASASATYGGDDNHEGSTGNGSFEIEKASSTTTVTCIGSPVYTGSPITPCSVTVTGANLNLTPAPVYANNVNAGTNTASASYTFAGDANHTGSDDSKTFSIAKANATVNVSGYSGVYDGNSHGASGTATGVNGEDLISLLNLGASFTNVPGGTASWTFNAGAVNGNYNSTGGAATISITKATPEITWSNPGDIVYGTALSSTQLNATANVAGAFSYTPASGTVLNAGPTQPLMAGFTPTDTTNYNATSKNVQINVLKATPSFSNLSSPTIAYGTATTNLSGKLTFGSLIPTGSVAITLNGVTQNASIQAGGTFSSSFATGSLAPGSYAISYSYGGDSNFNPANGAGTLTVGYGIVALYDQTKAHHSGSTIPIKLKITDVNGNNLSSANTVVTAVGIALISTTAYGPVEDSGNSNPDNNFRLSGDSYIFNLKTTGLSSGVYNLYFTVGADPTLHTVQFQIS